MEILQQNGSQGKLLDGTNCQLSLNDGLNCKVNIVQHYVLLLLRGNSINLSLINSDPEHLEGILCESVRV